jgi:exonuclease VII large subunit
VLAALDPSAVLQRGYAALQRTDDGQPVYSVSQVETGASIIVLLADGALKSSIEAALLRSSQAMLTR